MSVKLATQIFSRNVAAAIKSAKQMNAFNPSIDKYASPTAEFLENMDKLFDALNSKFLNHSNIFNSALKLDNPPVKHLEFMLYYLSRVDISGQIHWKQGLIQTIRGVLLMSDLLKSTISAKFLLTSRLNQDVIENLFSLIRSHGGNNSNPSVYEVNYTIAKIMTMRIIFATRNSNCDNDDDEFVNVNWSEIFESERSENAKDSDRENVQFEERSEILNVSESDDCEDLQTSASVSLEKISERYYAGFVLSKKIKNCDSCIRNLTKKIDSNEIHPSETLIVERNYSQNIENCALYNP